MKIAIVGSGFIGATLPLAQNFHKKGYEADCFYFTVSGNKSVESLDFDRPLPTKNVVVKIPDNNLVYNYLNKDISVFIMPVLKRHYTLERYGVGKISRIINHIRTSYFIRWFLKMRYDRVILIDHSDETHQLALALKKQGVKFITSYHEVLENLIDGGMRKPVIESLQLGCQVAVHCDDIRDIIIARSGIDDIEKRISVMRVGPFESLWQYGDGKPISGIGKDYLLFIGRIIPYKGLGILYEAVEILKEKYDLKVVIAGVGNDPVLEKVRNNARYTLINRFIENDEMVWLTKNCRAVVCPYIAASQSGMIPLSMAFGKPMIATNVGAFPEVIEEGKNGYMAKAGDCNDFARAIETCIVNEKSYPAGYVPEILNWDFITQQYIKLLSSL